MAEDFTTDKRKLPPGGEDIYALHVAWPYERGHSEKEAMDWTNTIDTPHGYLAFDLMCGYTNSEGKYSDYLGMPPPYEVSPTGGLWLVNWFEFEVVAEFDDVPPTPDPQPPILLNFWLTGVGTNLWQSKTLAPGTVTTLGALYPQGLPNPGPDKDGNAFLYWTYFDEATGTWQRVGPDFPVDTANMKVVNGVIDFNFVAVYEEPEDCPWWQVLLGGTILGGLGVGAAGVTIGSMTLPWLLAIPLLPVLILLGKFIYKEVTKPDDKPEEPKEPAKPAEPTEPAEELPATDPATNIPPTGDSLRPVLFIGLAGLLAAAAAIGMLRRKRREDELFA